MRLFETESLENADDIKNFILQNCREYLKTNPNFEKLKLYRGFYNSIIGIHKIPTHRAPIDTKKLFHKHINAAFKIAGFTSRRDNSIFCTGSLEQASNYGDAFVIYPIGNFSFTWSEKVHDLADDYFLWVDKKYVEIPEDYKLTKKLFLHAGISNSSNVSFPISIGDYIEQTGNDYILHNEFVKEDIVTNVPMEELIPVVQKIYKQDNLIAAIKSENEITISGGSYLAIPTDLDKDVWK